MIELYEDFKKMLIENQKEVMNKKVQFNREVKGLTKEARQYMLQLTGYGDEINRNINSINKKIQNFKNGDEEA